MGRHRFDVVMENLVPISVVFLIVIGVLVWCFLELTRHGRLMYAVGSNARAAALTGTDVNGYKILAYAISGVLASVGRPLLLAARLGRGDIASGTNLLLDRRGGRPYRLRRPRCGQTECLRHRHGRAFSSESSCRA